MSNELNLATSSAQAVDMSVFGRFLRRSGSESGDAVAYWRIRLVLGYYL